MVEEILKRLDSLNLSDASLMNVIQVSQVLGLSSRRARILVKPKNPVTRSRIKANFNELHGAYEIRVGDLREFIQNDYAHAKPGRPKKTRNKMNSNLTPNQDRICPPSAASTSFQAANLE
jgi:hypothetical protein